MIDTDKGATIGDIVHDENTPGDGPLLGADQTAALGGRCDLRDIDGDLGGADADGDAVDDAANDEHGDVLGGTDQDGPDAPELVVSTRTR